MPAPECTCGACQVTFCPLHEAAADLYTALEALLDSDPAEATRYSMLRYCGRAALLKANPDRTQEAA